MKPAGRRQGIAGVQSAAMSPSELTAALFAEARRLGFDLCGACPAVEPPGLSRLAEWLDAGYAGQMHYLPGRQDAYAHPAHVLAGARSIVMLGMHYRTDQPQQAAAGSGQVSRYAWGDDYHNLIHQRLDDLCAYHRRLSPDAVVRGVVDTAPLLEREFAQLSGLGWIGKNTLLLNRQAGSWFFLAALLTTAELVYHDGPSTNHCGTCRACLDACPTDAFVDAYVLDARRCISYLTIELRASIPSELRGGLGSWVFGCDVCQDVCPWNRHAPHSDQPAFAPAADTNPLELAALFYLDETAFRQRFRHTPLWRPRRRGLLRNAALVLGNQAAQSAVPALIVGLEDDESLVRGACAWALGRCGGTAAVDALHERAARETDPDVRCEIAAALETARPD